MTVFDVGICVVLDGQPNDGWVDSNIDLGNFKSSTQPCELGIFAYYRLLCECRRVPALQHYPGVGALIAFGLDGCTAMARDAGVDASSRSDHPARLMLPDTHSADCA